MAIDILPTIAEITNSKLPNKKIDGKSVWNIWKGETEKSPHEAYYFYYKRMKCMVFVTRTGSFIFLIRIDH